MNKTFKDFLARDIAATFVNTNEFGETVEFHGQQVDVVYETDNLKIRSSHESLVDCDVIFNISKSYFKGSIPKPGINTTFEGKKYRIQHASNNDGLLLIGIVRVS